MEDSVVRNGFIIVEGTMYSLRKGKAILGACRSFLVAVMELGTVSALFYSLFISVYGLGLTYQTAGFYILVYFLNGLFLKLTNQNPAKMYATCLAQAEAFVCAFTLAHVLSSHTRLYVICFCTLYSFGEFVEGILQLDKLKVNPTYCTICLASGKFSIKMPCCTQALHVTCLADMLDYDERCPLCRKRSPNFLAALRVLKPLLQFVKKLPKSRQDVFELALTVSVNILVLIFSFTGGVKFMQGWNHINDLAFNISVTRDTSVCLPLPLDNPLLGL